MLGINHVQGGAASAEPPELVTRRLRLPLRRSDAGDGDGRCDAGDQRPQRHVLNPVSRRRVEVWVGTRGDG